VWSVDDSVIGASLAAGKDLSDIYIDDDYSMLNEFLASTTLTSGKLDQRVSVIFFLNLVHLLALLKLIFLVHI